MGLKLVSLAPNPRALLMQWFKISVSREGFLTNQRIHTRKNKQINDKTAVLSETMTLQKQRIVTPGVSKNTTEIPEQRQNHKTRPKSPSDRQD